MAGELDSKSDGHANQSPVRSSLTSKFKETGKEDTEDVLNRVRKAQTQKEEQVK